MVQQTRHRKLITKKYKILKPENEDEVKYESLDVAYNNWCTLNYAKTHEGRF